MSDLDDLAKAAAERPTTRPQQSIAQRYASASKPPRLPPVVPAVSDPIPVKMHAADAYRLGIFVALGFFTIAAIPILLWILLIVLILGGGLAAAF